MRVHVLRNGCSSLCGIYFNTSWITWLCFHFDGPLFIHMKTYIDVRFWIQHHCILYLKLGRNGDTDKSREKLMHNNSSVGINCYRSRAVSSLLASEDYYNTSFSNVCKHKYLSGMWSHLFNSSSHEFAQCTSKLLNVHGESVIYRVHIGYVDIKY